MIHYGKFRVKSWSQNARNFVDGMRAGCEYEIAAGRATHDETARFMIETLQNSYRNPLIIKRAAKRLHRKGWV